MSSGTDTTNCVSVAGAVVVVMEQCSLHLVSITPECVDNINRDHLMPSITVSFLDSLLKVVEVLYGPPRQLYHGLEDLVNKKCGWLLL